MANLKQSDRLMQFSSPLGRDVLLIETLDGAEGISRLFEFNVQLLATSDTTIDPKAIIGSKVSVAIALNDAPGSRWVNGIVASFEQSSGDVEFDIYHARIVPSLWQLTLSSNCRVFQNMTVMDIVKKVIGEYGLSLSDQTSTSYKTLDYCTQYDESDFHFISRILEQNGIFYWFEHTEQDNKIVFGDGRTAYADCPLSSSVVYEPDGSGREGAYGSGVWEFSATAAMVSGKHATRDYDFRIYGPHDVPSKTSASPFGRNGYEHFLYPAGEEGYVKETSKELSTPDFAALFLDSEVLASDAVSEVFQGTSNARSFCCGYTFTMDKHARSAWNRKYLLTEVIHQVTQVPSYKADGMAGGSGYSNRFSAVSSDIVFKPALTAHKPRIYGPQTAMVVAPSGEEMFIDKLGRVCVQFFWDRDRKPNTIDNTWVRVAQPWAGSGWGTFFWPRLKDEVVVQFLNGDPDNPVVTGSVYNGVNVPKYALPDHSTRSGLVTRSSKGGSAQNANELRFEDKTGSEQIFLNAERDMDHRTENDNRRFVGGKDSLIVKGSQDEEVDADRHANIKGNTVDKVGGNSDLNIASNLNQKVGSNYSLQVGQNHGEKVGQNYAMDAGMQVYIKAGQTVVIESGMNLCLKGAGGFITIGPSGIAISGTMVMINSGGAAVPGSPASLTAPGDPTAPDQADDGSKGGKKN
jgi:type VI secretion system secreted protein VgrG